MASKSIKTISLVLGWIYVICWSISFYPQVWLNFKRKSVTGLSFDFVVISIVGFLCYSIYTVALYFVPAVQNEYKLRHNGEENLIALNDVIFSLHALLVTIIYGVQVLIYRKKGERMSTFGSMATVSSAVLIAVLAVISINGQLAWLDFIYIMSYLKLITTAGKYVPQVYLNYSLKSTLGWNVKTVLLDFIGGILSITQLLMDAFNSNDLGGIKGAAAKLILGLISILFDIIFMLQHYVWYRNADHQRIVVPVQGKDSELASPVDGKGAHSPFPEGHGTANYRKGSPIRENVSVEDMEAQPKGEGFVKL